MYLLSQLGNYRTTVILIHRFRKLATEWDDIANVISKTSNVVRIQLDDDDYCLSIPQVCNNVITAYNQLNLRDRSVIIVGHSLGCMYAIQLALVDPNRFAKLLLLEPVIKDNAYLDELRTKMDVNDNVSIAKVRHYEDLPDGRTLRSSIIVRIHLNGVHISIVWLIGMSSLV